MTQLCVVQTCSGMRDTVCYLHKPTFSLFQVYSTKTTGPILIKIMS